MAKRLVVIDGYSLLYRAFFATRFLSTADGRPTNALLGFTNMLFNLLENVRPDAIFVALDAPGKTFRHAEYAEYKGTRRETAEELKVQLPIARDLIAALGIPQIEITGYEADDVVGTVSLQAELAGYDTTIVTGDLDALQLVDECVSVLTMKMGVTDTVTYDVAAVEERYGFGPKLIPDYKAIVGDTSDNIPGVPGIGAKGASDLISRFGSVDDILANFDSIDEKYKKKIAGNEEQMRKSRWLATIDRNAPLAYDFAPFTLTNEQIEKTKAMFEWLEFRGLIKRAPNILSRYIDGFSVENDEPTPIVETRLEVKSRKAESRDELFNWVDDRTYALIFSLGEMPKDLFDSPPPKRAYVAVGSEVRDADEAWGMELLAANPSKAILHDGKAVYKEVVRACLGSHCPPTIGFDTMIAGYVLQSGRGSYALTDLVQGYLEIVPPTQPEEMAAALYLLKDALEARLVKEGQSQINDSVEAPLIPLLAEMELYGVRVSGPALKEFGKSLEGHIARTGAHIFELAGEEFNIGSPKQLGVILFEKMGIPGQGKTKTGYATGAEVLTELAPTYEIAAEIMNWRELSKLKSTYADALERMIGTDGRIHTTYNQTGAATGRLSSNDPNLQNIPIRTELGRGIRQAFLVADDYVLASLDYSQIELRVLAHMCRDDALVQAFETKQDVHTVTAQYMFGLGQGEATKEQRRLAKMLNYAVLYGVTDFGLAQQLGSGFSIAEAKGLITQYNERFPKIKEFTEAIVQEARSKGFTSTLMGRRRYFPDIHAPKINERRYAERQAMNAPIQGTAADLLKLAMIASRKVLEGQKSRMVLNVHDELVFEIYKGEEHLIEPLRRAMEDALPLNVPVEVDAKTGLNWDQMTPVERNVVMA